MSAPIEFLLNDQIANIDASQTTTVLSYLRDQRTLKGTKEGCAEGDCGACTVLVGRVKNGALNYVSMNSCIAFLPMLHGAHVVTIEALSNKGQLHWVQQALADFHGTQCGFCTPGIVMSLYAMWMENEKPTRDDVEKHMQGNLCRCTGYASILRGIEARSGDANLAQDSLVTHRAEVIAKLAAIGKSASPTTIKELQQALTATPNATIVAGATDVGLWVTKRLQDITPAIYIGQIEELQNIEFSDDTVTIGAGVSYSQAERDLTKVFPQLAEFWPRIAGQQVRNLGTIGGNIANGSPIGDMPPVLIALNARLVLNKGGALREIALEDYFIDYGKQDLQIGEFVQSIIVPRHEQDALKVYKVSKRRDEDISSVLGALYIIVENDVISSARIAFGGMAATPKRARKVEEFITGKNWDEETIRAAMKLLEDDLAPISDMRASASYRMKAAQNMFLRHLFDH